jgi:hypothetical protein
MNSTASRTPRRAGQAEREVHRIEVLLQRLQLSRVGQAPAERQRDAADLQQPVELGLRKAAGHLVARQAVLVQPAGCRARIVQRHRMAASRELECAGDAGRPGTHHGDAPAGRRGALEQRGHRPIHHRIDRITLQSPDLDRLALLRHAHADLLAQLLGRAGARAGAAERVGFEDRARRAAQVVVGDAADEARHVDAGRTGRGARRVVAVQAALGLDQRLGAREPRRRVAKGLRVLGSAAPGAADVGQALGMTVGRWQLGHARRSFVVGTILTIWSRFGDATQPACHAQ